MKVAQNLTLYKNQGRDSWWAHKIYRHTRISQCLYWPTLVPDGHFLDIIFWATGFLFLNNDMLSFSCKMSSASPFTVQSLSTNVSRCKDLNFYLSWNFEWVLTQKEACYLRHCHPCPLLATMYYVSEVLFFLHELFTEQITIYLRLSRVQFLHASFYPGW